MDRKVKIPDFEDNRRAAAEAIHSVSRTAFYEMLKVLRSHVNKKSTILVFGNGGSASNAAHFASDLTQSLLKQNCRTNCLAANNDVELNTALSNDFSFRYLLAKRTEAHLRQGDLLIVLSVSGESENIIEGISAASKLGASTLGLFGAAKSTASEMVDCHLSVKSSVPEIVETAHLFVVQELARRA